MVIAKWHSAHCLIMAAVVSVPLVFLPTDTVRGQDRRNTPANTGNSGLSAEFPSFDELMLETSRPAAPPSSERITPPPTQPVEQPQPERRFFEFGTERTTVPARPISQERNSGAGSSFPSFGRPSPGVSETGRDDRTGRGTATGSAGSNRNATLPSNESTLRFRDETGIASEKFHWQDHTTSDADLKFPTSVVFKHGDPFLTADEEIGYLDLINAVGERRRSLVQRTVEESAGHRVSIWEQAFYQYAVARHKAWDNGKLRAEKPQVVSGSGLPDPFRAPGNTAPLADPLNAGAPGTPFSLLDDIADFPDDYLGRPILLYGRFSAKSVVRITRPNQTAALFDGGPQDLSIVSEAKMLRGSLMALDSSRLIAEVDTQGLLTPQRGLLGPTEWPATDTPVAVLVKGWVVKKWDSRPLIYCEALRQISPIPHYELIRNNTHDKRSLQDDETWLYYETLRQLELTSPVLQEQVAEGVLQQRIDSLMTEVRAETDRRIGGLQSRLRSGALTEDAYRRQRQTLNRQLAQRVARYRTYRENPEDFQTFVDLFQNPEVWHGHLVTFHGHVRHVVNYPGDDVLLNGRTLHELWLFTDDSQHNPVVVVTPNLPADFPVRADVIDHVKVTGCFFKRYVYGSQDTDRIAPLVLAGNLTWEPTADQVQTLVDAGHLSAGAPRAVRARALNEHRLSNTAMVLVTFCAVLAIMVLWGRTLREERDRVRLRKRIEELPEFESRLAGGYTLPEPGSPMEEHRFFTDSYI
ncbi:MAG: hypothetical protein KDA89_00585 [Planctomycetaceae bacterium]|nr:hypothetical protein [Planctomycetaceae bacterium]